MGSGFRVASGVGFTVAACGFKVLSRSPRKEGSICPEHGDERRTPFCQSSWVCCPLKGSFAYDASIAHVVGAG